MTATEGDTPADLPTFDQLLYPTIQALIELGGSGTVDEIHEKLGDNLHLSDAAVNYRRPRATINEVPYRAAWARTYLKNFGAIERTRRGVWALTPLGRGLDAATAARIPAKVRQKSRSTEGDTANGVEPELALQVREEIAEDWKETLVTVLNELTPAAFERLAQRMLRESGFIKVEVTGRSGDGGIDGIGVLRINLISFQVLFQCKKYKDTVGAGAIRDFRGAMVGRSDKGLIITTGRFTPDAVREATRDGAPPIELIDGSELCTLLKQLGLGVRTEMVERVQIDEKVLKSI